MIDKILSWTKGKTCFNLQRKNKTKNDFKRPTLTIENPIFPTSVIVAYSKPLTFLDIFGCGLWGSQKRQYESKPRKPRRLFTVCRWYKRRKVLKQKEKEIKNKKRYEYEQEIVKDILRWEEGKQRQKDKEQFENLYVIPLEEKKKDTYLKESKKDKNPLSWPKRKKVKKDIYIEDNEHDVDENKKEKIKKNWLKAKKAKKKEIVEETKYEPLIWPKPEHKRPNAKKKEIYVNETKHEPYAGPEPVKKNRRQIKNTVIKEKSAAAKPKAVTKQVYVKTYHKKDSLTHRFVTCCYRLCCQFYCCINCVLVIVFVVMFVL